MTTTTTSGDMRYPVDALTRATHRVGLLAFTPDQRLLAHLFHAHNQPMWAVPTGRRILPRVSLDLTARTVLRGYHTEAHPLHLVAFLGATPTGDELTAIYTARLDTYPRPDRNTPPVELLHPGDLPQITITPHALQLLLHRLLHDSGDPAHALLNLPDLRTTPTHQPATSRPPTSRPPTSQPAASQPPAGLPVTSAEGRPA